MDYTLDELGLIDPRTREPARSSWDGLERFTTPATERVPKERSLSAGKLTSRSGTLKREEFFAELLPTEAPFFEWVLSEADKRGLSVG